MEISDCEKRPFSDGAAWFRGSVVPIEQAMIPVNDWGLVHSDITYDVVPVRGGAFFHNLKFPYPNFELFSKINFSIKNYKRLGLKFT